MKTILIKILTTIYLLFSIFILAWVGIEALFYPEVLTEYMGYMLTSKIALVDLKATYGGLHLGIALALIVLIIQKNIKAAVGLNIILFGSSLFGRSFAMVQNNVYEQKAVNLFLTEFSIVTLGIGLYLYYIYKKQ